MSEQLEVSCQNCGEYKIDLQGHRMNQAEFTEHYPTEREIVSALAGELMTTCIQVSDWKSGAGVHYSKGRLTEILDCTIYQVEEFPVITFVDLESEGAAEQLRDLIKRVAALGEVSR